MKKRMILAIVALAAISTPAFAVAFHSHRHEQGANAFRCSFCKGTGFQNGNGNTACFACKGSGFNGSY